VYTMSSSTIFNLLRSAMSSSFQPADPHPPSRRYGISFVLLTGAGLALAVMMIVAIVLPRYFLDTTTSWVATLGSGIGTFALVLAYDVVQRMRGATPD